MSLDERADALDKELERNPIDSTIEILARDAKRRQRQILVLTISLVLDVFLTIGFGWLAIQANETAANVQKSKDSIIASCKTGNEFRATEAALWNHIIELSSANPTVPLTPEQEARRQKTITEFQAYLKTTFASRDCNNIIEK